MEELRQNLELWMMPEVYEALPGHDRERLRRMGSKLKKSAKKSARGERLDRDAAVASISPNVDRVGWNDSDGDGVPSEPSAQPVSPWLQLHTHDDTGLEVPVLYSPGTGEVRESPTQGGGVFNFGDDVALLEGFEDGSQPAAFLTVASMEQQVDEVCAKAEKGAQPSRPDRTPQLDCADHIAGYLGDPLAWCETPLTAERRPSKNSRRRSTLLSSQAAGSFGQKEAEEVSSKLMGKVVSSHREHHNHHRHRHRHNSPSSEQDDVARDRREVCRAQNFPRPIDTNQPPLRPEDVDAIAAEEEHSKAIRELEREFHAAQKAGRDTKDKKEIRGVGPAAAVPAAHEHAFNPVSFFPEGHLAAADEHIAGEGEEIISGHDRTQPGRVPWRVFRTSTWLITVIWAFAGVLSLPAVDQVLGVRTVPLPEVMSREMEKEEDDSETMQAFQESDEEPDRRLTEGEEIALHWPPRRSFEPHALACDPSGRRVAIADSFGIFYGKLEEAPTLEEERQPSRYLSGTQEASRNEQTAASERSLRGASWSLRPKLRMSFQQQPPCSALEGQAVKDIGMVCSGSEQHSECVAVALAGRGRQLAACPLSGALTSLPTEEVGSVSEQTSQLIWEITSNWLNTTEERVESLAVDAECKEWPILPSTHAQQRSVPEAGCVVVGTSRGRLVQLQPHQGANHQLVPLWAMQQKSNSVYQGSLHLFSGGLVLALRPGRNSLQALDLLEGAQIGEWKLPKTVPRWLALAGGGDQLYVLGESKLKQPRLFRFKLPPELCRGARELRVRKHLERVEQEDLRLAGSDQEI